MDIPVVIYDRERQIIYQENSDGTRIESGKRLRKGVIVSVLQKRPEVIAFAGPNGSGKSTFTELLKPPIDYINADEIKKNIKCTDLEAAQLAERQREVHFKQMSEFCFETVLFTERNIKLLQKAKQRGYIIRCYYILTADPMINVLQAIQDI